MKESKQAWINYCLEYYESIEDYTFDEGITTVMKVKANGKMFALIAEKEEGLYINVKCNPDDALLLRDQYKGITPGYHMNKKHWNSIYIGSDVEEAMIEECIERSFYLVAPKHRK